MTVSLSARVRAKVGALELDVALETGPSTLVLVGPNGAGKTSLLSILLGVVGAAEGRIEARSHVLLDSATGVNVPVEARRLGYVPQDYALFPHLTVAQNVAFAIDSSKRSGMRTEHVARALQDLGIQHLSTRRPRTLSGGEKQRVALARALSVEPRALLLDEPLAALDVHARREVRAFLADTLRRLALPTVLVTHDPEDARLLGHRIAVLEQGRITQHGSWDELASAPKTPFVAEFTSDGRPYG